MKIQIRMITLLALILLAGPLRADEAESRQAAQQLAAILQGYESFQANFVQIVVGGNGTQVQELRGLLRARRPGLFYWETQAPMAQYIVSDGRQVEVYDPDLEQVTIHRLDSRIQSTPALLLSGEVENLDEIYRITEHQPAENIREFTLEPRSPDALFVSLRLTFDQGELQEMRMTDSLSQLSILSFDHIRLNAPLNQDQFVLDYPEGVDIVRDAD